MSLISKLNETRSSEVQVQKQTCLDSQENKNQIMKPALNLVKITIYFFESRKKNKTFKNHNNEGFLV